MQNDTTVPIEDMPLSWAGKNVVIENEELRLSGNVISVAASYNWDANSVTKEIRMYAGGTVIPLKGIFKDTTVTLIEDNERPNS